MFIVRTRGPASKPKTDPSNGNHVVVMDLNGTQIERVVSWSYGFREGSHPNFLPNGRGVILNLEYPARGTEWAVMACPTSLFGSGAGVGARRGLAGASGGGGGGLAGGAGGRTRRGRMEDQMGGSVRGGSRVLRASGEFDDGASRCVHLSDCGTGHPVAIHAGAARSTGTGGQSGE